MPINLQTRVEAAINTLRRTGSKAAAAGSFLFPSSMTWSGRGSYLSIAPRNFPYWQTDPLANSAVVNTLGWVQRNFGQARLQVARLKRDDTKEPIKNHPMVRLINRPNPWYGGATLWSATLFSYHTEGNAYWIKRRNARGFGVPTELWYEPHWSIKPYYPPDGSVFIEYYERRVNGRIERLKPADVVHFRNGLNAGDYRYGWAPLKAALLQVFSDTEVNMWIAALAKNNAMPSVVISPTDNSYVGMTEEKAEQIVQKFERKYGGDNRGRIGVLDFNASIEQLSFDPSQMDFSAITSLAEARISGAIGVPAIVAGLSTGLDSSTYNNLENLKKSAFEECLIPNWECFEDELDLQLLPDFEADPEASGVSSEFDTTHIKALKEDQDKAEMRAREAYRNAGITLNEFRAVRNLPPVDGGDFLLLPNNVRPVTPEVAIARAGQEITDPAASPPGSDDSDTTERDKLLRSFFFQKAEFDGIPLLREPTELEALVIKQIDAAMRDGAQSLNGTLLEFRRDFIFEALEELEFLDPADYHALTVNPTDDQRETIYKQLAALFNRGATLIVEELNQQGGEISEEEITDPDEDQEQGLEDLAAVTTSKVANEVQARVINSAISAVTLGRELVPSVLQDMADGSTAYVSRAANEGTNSSLAAGRKAQIETLYNKIGTVIYSAVLDKNTCGPCEEADGSTGPLESLWPVPNPNCKGGAQCRCIHIAVLADPNAETLPAPAPKPAPPPKPGEEEDTGAGARARLKEIGVEFEQELAQREKERRGMVESWLNAPSQKERRRIDKEITAFDRTRAKLEDEFLTRYRETLYQSKPAKFTLDKGAGFDKDGEKVLKQGVKGFERLVGAGKIDGKTIRAISGGDRSYYSNGEISIRSTATARVVLHELGHWLEESNPAIQKAVFDFYERRTKNDEVERLIDLLPENGYDPQEVAKKDRFLIPYMGKVYLNSEASRYATEILSMGLELLYDDPVTLATEDPEYFDFIYELLRIQ